MGYQFETDPDQGEDKEYYIVNPEYAERMEKIEQLEKRFQRFTIKREEILAKYQNLKRKADLKTYLKQKGNKKVVNAYFDIKAQLEQSRENISKMEGKIPYSQLHNDKKDIIKTVRSSVLLGIRASAYNMRKRFEEMAAACFKDYRELGKFVCALTTTPATVTRTSRYCFVKLQRFETPVYKEAAKKLIGNLNRMNTKMLDDDGRQVIFQF